MPRHAHAAKNPSPSPRPAWRRKKDRTRLNLLLPSLRVVCRRQHKICGGKLLVGEDPQLIGRRPHTVRGPVQLFFWHGIKAENPPARPVFAEGGGGRSGTKRA